MKTPASVYVLSAKPYSGLPEISYPLHDREALVTNCGRFYLNALSPLAA